MRAIVVSCIPVPAYRARALPRSQVSASKSRSSGLHRRRYALRVKLTEAGSGVSRPITATTRRCDQSLGMISAEPESQRGGSARRRYRPLTSQLVAVLYAVTTYAGCPTW